MHKPTPFIPGCGVFVCLEKFGFFFLLFLFFCFVLLLFSLFPHMESSQVPNCIIFGEESESLQQGMEK